MYIRVELNLCYNHKVPASLKQAKVSGVCERPSRTPALYSLYLFHSGPASRLSSRMPRISLDRSGIILPNYDYMIHYFEYITRQE